MSIMSLMCVLRRRVLPLGRWVVVSVHLLVPVHWHTAINRLVLRMRREHPVVSRVRVRLVVVDLDLLRRHALYALHCKGCALVKNYGVQ